MALDPDLPEESCDLRRAKTWSMAGEAWRPEYGRAWAEAIGVVAGAMLEGAAGARLEGAA